MDQYEYIRVAHRVYGKNISEIMKMTGHSRNTIKKALRGEAWSYKERERQVYPVLGPYLKIVDKWLEEDKASPKKQRHTGRRIYSRLKDEHDYQGAESTVRRYVREAKARLGMNASQAYIPLDPEVGLEAEVDWGTAMAIIQKSRVRLKYFCMRSKYSGMHFVRFYPCERQQAFFDAHMRAFDFFGGIFPTLIYDNLTTAVQKILKGKGRKEQEAFGRFRSFYNFEARYCNPSQGHEKGGVEGMVGFVRRNYMVPIPEGDCIEELNEEMLKKCLAHGEHRISGREKKVYELFEEEKSHLLSLPPSAFSNIQIYDGKVDKYATLIVDKNRYSVPYRYVGFTMKALAGVDRVEIFSNGKKLASHERLYNNNKWSLDPDHYLELIQQRPASFHSARPIRQWRQRWPKSMNDLLSRFCEAQGETQGIKDFINVLMLHRQYGADDVQAAIELALESQISESSGVKQILIYSQDLATLSPSLENWPKTPPPDLSDYSRLGGEG